MSHNDEKLASGQKRKNPASGRRSWLLFPLGLIIAMAVGWGLWPTLFYAKKTQPFSFKHLVHSERAGLECETCHYFDETGRFSGAPGFDECLKCHTWNNRQKEDSQFESAFLTEFVDQDGKLKKNPSWYVYSRQPDNVYFPHAAHVKMAKIRCEYCHGDHGRTSGLRPYYENRLTNYSRDVYERMKMTDCTGCHNNCAACHTEQGIPANNACYVCHK